MEAKIAECTKKNYELNKVNKEITETAEERKLKNMDMIAELNKIKVENLTLKEEKKSLKDINCMLEVEGGCSERTERTEKQKEAEKSRTHGKDKGYYKEKDYRTYECRYGSRCTRVDCWFDHPTNQRQGQREKRGQKNQQR